MAKSVHRPPVNILSLRTDCGPCTIAIEVPGWVFDHGAWVRER